MKISQILICLMSVFASVSYAMPNQTSVTASFDQQYSDWKKAQPVVSLSSGAKVNINTAGIEELQTLIGVGENKAKEIIAYRKRKGKFQSIEQLKEVKGFGDSLFDKNKNRLSL